MESLETKPSRPGVAQVIQESMESTEMESITVDMPTIAISDEDELDELDKTLNLRYEDGLSPDNMHDDGYQEFASSDEGLADHLNDSNVGSSARLERKKGIKSKVRGLVSKVKGAFSGKDKRDVEDVPMSSSTFVQRTAEHKSKESLDRGRSREAQSAIPVEKDFSASQLQVHDYEAEATRRRLEEELAKKAEELKRKESELKQKEEAAAKNVEVAVKKMEEERAKLVKEEEKMKRDFESKAKVENAAREKEREMAKKREEVLKKRELELKAKEKALKEAEKEAVKRQAEEKKRLEAETRATKKMEKKKEVTDELLIEAAAREAQVLDEKIRAEKLAAEKAAGYVCEPKVRKIAKIKALSSMDGDEDFENEERALQVDLTVTEDLKDYYNFAAFNMGTSSEFGDTSKLVTPQASFEVVEATEPVSEHTLCENEELPGHVVVPKSLRGEGQSQQGLLTTDDEMSIPGIAAGSESEGVPGSTSTGLDKRARRKKMMSKRLRDAKNRLKDFTSRVCETSIHGVERVRSRVSDIFSARSPSPANSMGYESVGGTGAKLRTEAAEFHDYKNRYPESEAEFFSDSEVAAHKRRQMRGDPSNFYEDMFTTDKEPKRPPRRSEPRVKPAFSVPNMSSAPPKPMRRVPPPRPPLPSSNRQTPGHTSLEESQFVDVPLDESASVYSATTSAHKGHSQPPPPKEFYRGVRQDWRQRHSQRLQAMLSRSQPALKSAGKCISDIGSGLKAGFYDCPRKLAARVAPPPKRPPPPSQPQYDRPRLPVRRVSLTMPRAVEVVTIWSSRHEERYEPVGGLSGLPPIAPPRPRRGRSATRSPSASRTSTRLQPRNLHLAWCPTNQMAEAHIRREEERAELAANPLLWRPYTWKTPHCRSLTELYVQARGSNQQLHQEQGASRLSRVDKAAAFGHYENETATEQFKLRYQLTTSLLTPIHPFRPSQSAHSHPLPAQCVPIREVWIDEPIYSFVRKGKKPGNSSQGQVAAVQGSSTSVASYDRMKGRPLPPPPLPPPKAKWLASPVVPPTARLRRSMTPGGVLVKDAAVSTKDIREEPKTREMEVQTSLEDLSDVCATRTLKLVSITSLKKMNEKRKKSVDENANFSSRKFEGTLTSAARSPNKRNSLGTSPYEDDNSPSALSSKTIGSYHDAQEGHSTDHVGGGCGADTFDQDTFNDVDSIGEAATLSSSHFHSVDATPLASPSLERQAVEERVAAVLERSRPLQSASMPVSRSSSSRPLAVTQSPHRRFSAGARAAAYQAEVDDESDEDTDDLMDLAAGLQQELKQILERRASKPSRAADDDGSDSDL